METFKIITQEEYDMLPGEGAAIILNGLLGKDKYVLNYAQCVFKNGDLGIAKYWADENGKRWIRFKKFIPGEQY